MNSTKLRDRVLVSNPCIKSRAAIILLIKKYKNELRQYKPEWRIWLSFRNRFLNNQSKKGQLACNYCGRTNLVKNGRVVGPTRQATVDHVIPLAKGGRKYDERNLVVSCRRCNEKKADK